MAVKKNNYITTELDWAETQLASWKQYIDDNPMHTLEDRVKWKETRGGGTMPMVVASIESQIKAISDLMTRYLALLEVVDKLREKDEAKKVETRGNTALSTQAEEFLENRKNNNGPQ